jgi:cytochrome b subunit of formate dehydrogenase
VAEQEIVQRYGRAARWFHAGIYVTVLVLLVSGWWFVVGGYRGSALARLTGLPDETVHELAGFAMALVILAWLPFGLRSTARFVRDSLRYRRSDGRWLAVWPRSAFTGRFPHHDGHFDPGQRLANLVMLGTLAALVLSGFAMLFGLGPSIVDMVAVHRWSTFLLTPVLLGHIVVASGVLPGYRGVWRSMHLGGRLRADVARRLWPAWLAARERGRR